MTSSGNRHPSSSIVSARAPKHGHPVLPQEPDEDKILISRQWILAVRGFNKRALDRSEYTIREIGNGSTRPCARLRLPGGRERRASLPDEQVRHAPHGRVPCLRGRTRRRAERAHVRLPEDARRRGVSQQRATPHAPVHPQAAYRLDRAGPHPQVGADETFYIPSRDGYMAMVTEIEYLRERVAELDPSAAPRLGAPEIVRAADTERPPPPPQPRMARRTKTKRVQRKGDRRGTDQAGAEGDKVIVRREDVFARKWEALKKMGRHSQQEAEQAGRALSGLTVFGRIVILRPRLQGRHPRPRNARRLRDGRAGAVPRRQRVRHHDARGDFAHVVDSDADVPALPEGENGAIEDAATIEGGAADATVAAS